MAVHGNVWHWNGSVWHYIEMCGSSRNRVAAHGECVEEDVVCVSRLKYVSLEGNKRMSRVQCVTVDGNGCQ